MNLANKYNSLAPRILTMCLYESLSDNKLISAHKHTLLIFTPIIRNDLFWFPPDLLLTDAYFPPTLIFH